MTVFESNRPLLDAFRAGDRQALEVVYMFYVDAVFNLVRFGFLLADGKRVVGTTRPDMQRELVHDVFVRAFAERARISYDGLRPYRPFLLRLARNVIIDAWRRRGLTLADPADVEELATETPTDDDLDWQRLTHATRTWSATLDDECKRFVALRFEEGLGQRDVAKSMGATRRRVRTLETVVRRGLLAHLTRLGLAD